MTERNNPQDPFIDLRADLKRQALQNEIGREALAAIADFWAKPADELQGPSDAVRIDLLFLRFGQRIVRASAMLDERVYIIGKLDTAINTVDELDGFYSTTELYTEPPVDTPGLLEYLRDNKQACIETAGQSVKDILSPPQDDAKVSEAAAAQPAKKEITLEEKVEQAELLAVALIKRYEEFGTINSRVNPEMYSSIAQAAARGRLAVARLLKDGSNETLNKAVKPLQSNARDALARNVEARLIRAQITLARHPLAIGRKAPLWKQEDTGQEIVAVKIAETVAYEMALNAQLAGRAGSPKVAPPRLFRPPEKRLVNDFKIGDEVLCSPYVRSKNNKTGGLSRGTVVEVKSTGNKGIKVIVRVDKADGMRVDYSRPLQSRYLIHEACWRALRHSESLRKSWQKAINTSEEELAWPPLAR